MNVRVNTTEGLKTALASAYTDPGRVIEIEPGAYPFRGMLGWLGNKPDRPVRGLVVRGLGDRPQDVVLKGHSGPDGAMTPGYQPTGYGFILSDCTDVLFDNFEVRDVGTHLFHLKGEMGCSRVSFRRVHGYNAGEQFIKSTADKVVGRGIEDGVIESCHFGYELRDYVKRNIVQDGGPIAERGSAPTVVRVNTSPGSMARSAWDVDYWVGGTADCWEMVDGRKYTIRTCGVVRNWHDDPHDGTSWFELDAAVPEEADGVTFTIDRPDEIIPNSWGPQGGYTGAIDIHFAKRYQIRDCTFHRIGTSLGSAYGHAVPAIYAWGGSEDTLVERCHFLDCEQGVALGLGANLTKVPFQHRRGRVRDVWFYRHADVVGDRAVGFDSSIGSLCVGVKAVLNGTYRNCVEYRFPVTSDSVLLHVETDAPNVVAYRPEETQHADTCGLSNEVDAAAVLAEIERVFAERGVSTE